jgi:N-acetylated-alpha-linked acidic dipeptidase
VSGSRWNAGASPSLASLIHANALKVPHPTDKNRTLWDARSDSGPFKNGEFDVEFAATSQREEEYKRSQATENVITPLGSGSDFTVFLQRIGVASMDSGFGYTPSDAV